MKQHIKQQIVIILGALALAVVIRSELPAQSVETGTQQTPYEIEATVPLPKNLRWSVVFNDARGIKVRAGGKEHFFNAASASDVLELVRLHHEQVREAAR